MTEVTRTLARFVVDHAPAAVPPTLYHEATRALVNWMGCAIGSADHETVERAVRALSPCFGPPAASLFGRTERVDMLHAALLNGISSHVLDYDDTHARAVHPSAPVWPALLALAQSHPVSGRQLLHAFVLGVEVECRVGLSVFPEHYEIGWHITGTAGVFGAAAAAGKLLGLSEREMCWALGIAATQSSGLREMFGSMCKSLHPGRAAQGGLTAALLARAGFTSSEQAIEAKRGFAHVMSTRFDPDVITARLGETWELSNNMYKPFACGLVIHAVIDGCIQLAVEHDLVPEAIESVDLVVSPLVLELTGKLRPASGLEGKFSVYHAAASALIHRAGGEPQFSDACVAAHDVCALRSRVTATVDPTVRKTEAHVRVRLRDGRLLERHVEHALGTLPRPMSDADLEDKFRAQLTPRFTAETASAILEACWSIGGASDAGASIDAAAR
ncbi:MAG: MmgE/PrpD family protein [Proteobacteria bacterium]|nr:MmgE/PrpD family protein [Burkholderiales bacterium]